MLALLAVEIPARVVQVEDEIYDPSEVAAIVEPIFRQARAPQQSTTTLTIIKTTTLSSASTTVITTKKTCAVLGSFTTSHTLLPPTISTLSVAPAATCRRRRQYWNHPIFLGIRHEDDTHMQYIRLSPSQVVKFEPTMLPQFRNTNNPSINLIKESPADIQPSFEKDPDNVRVAQPVFGASLNSIISSIVSNIFLTTVTKTSTATAYSSVVTSTSFSATATYYVVGSCYPAGITLC